MGSAKTEEKATVKQNKVTLGLDQRVLSKNLIPLKSTMASDVLQNIRGLTFPSGPVFKKKNIEDALDYIPHDGDIIIASYPKTGISWLNYIAMQIISKGELYPDFDDCYIKYAPFLEMAGTSVLDKMKKPRIYKYHFPYNMVQKNSKAKYLYIYRRPEDAAISFYHFLTNLMGNPPGLDTYFEKFLLGNVGYGNYFDHVLSYYEHKNDENMLLVSYEKL
ncbi:sulfotransferase family cytosolic 1B member 1, partial [Nephila pilipes]